MRVPGVGRRVGCSAALQLQLGRRSSLSRWSLGWAVLDLLTGVGDPRESPLGREEVRPLGRASCLSILSVAGAVAFAPASASVEADTRT